MVSVLTPDVTRRASELAANAAVKSKTAVSDVQDVVEAP